MTAPKSTQWILIVSAPGLKPLDDTKKEHRDRPITGFTHNHTLNRLTVCVDIATEISQWPHIDYHKITF